MPRLPKLIIKLLMVSWLLLVQLTRFVALHCVYSCIVCVFVDSCPATKVFIGNFPAMGRGWVIIKANDEQRATTNKIVI